MSSTTSKLQLNFGKKEDLVDRVMESIKALNKNQEEASVSTKQTKTSTKKSEPAASSTLAYKNPPATTQNQGQRRRTNTLITNDRPNLTQYQ